MKSKGEKLANRFFSWMKNTMDPTLGKDMWRLRTAGIYFRYDGRPVSWVKSHGGLPAQMPEAAFKELKLSDIQKYQSYNEIPIGLGAVTGFPDLEKFKRDNPTHVEDKYIYGVNAKAFSLMALKWETGIESSPFDYENEWLIAEKISESDFLVAIAPEDQDRLFNGMEVKNAMATSSKLALPASLTRHDLATRESIFAWACRHDCLDIAVDLATAVFLDESPVDDKTRLAKAILALNLEENYSKALIERAFETLEKGPAASPSAPSP